MLSQLVEPRGGHGVVATGSTLNLFGGPTTELQGGDGTVGFPFFPNSQGGSGLVLQGGSTARIQAGIPIAGGFDALGASQQVPIQTDASSSSTLDPAVFPSLASGSQTVAQGDAFTLELSGNPAGFQVLFTSLGTGPDLVLQGVEGFGILDLAGLVQLATPTLDGAGSASLAFSAPANPSIVGTTFLFQAAEAFGLQLAIGNPVLVAATM